MPLHAAEKNPLGNKYTLLQECVCTNRLLGVSMRRYWGWCNKYHAAYNYKGR